MVERHLQMCVAWAEEVDRILYFDQNTDTLQIELWFTTNDARIRGHIIAHGDRCTLVLAVGGRFIFAAPVHNRLLARWRESLVIRGGI